MNKTGSGGSLHVYDGPSSSSSMYTLAPHSDPSFDESLSYIPSGSPSMVPVEEADSDEPPTPPPMDVVGGVCDKVVRSPTGQSKVRSTGGGRARSRTKKQDNTPTRKKSSRASGTSRPGSVRRAKSSSPPKDGGDIPLDPECTFKPVINTSYKAKSNVAKMALPDRVRHWETQAQQQKAKREEQRKEKEKQDLSNCTFTPTISEKSKKKAAKLGRKGKEGGLEVSERLHKEADRRVTDKEKAKKQREDSEVAKLPFTPSINPTSREVVKNIASAQKPLQERIDEIQRQKSANLHRLQLKEMINDTDLTFHPKINESSEALALKNRKGYVRYLEPHERLAFDSGGAVSKRIQQKAESERREKEDHTFTPELNENSLSIVNSSKLYQGPCKDFLQRQSVFNDLKEMNNLSLANRTVDKNCTYSPDIGNSEEVLSHSRKRHTFSQESKLERVERLACKDKHEREVEKRRLEEKYYSKFTFKPHINETSRAILQDVNRLPGQGQPLATSQTRTYRRSELEAAANFKKQHTFTPNLTPAHNLNMENVPPKYLVTADGGLAINQSVEQDKVRVQRKLQQYRDEAQRAEMDECTFAPQIKHWAPPAKGEEVAIPGLQHFLGTKAQARCLENDRKQREHDAFHYKAPPRKHNLSYTTPEPFRLSTAPTSQTMSFSRLQQEVQEQERKECTFKPDTLERRNKNLIRQILDEDE